jgi:flagellar hook assembly protein FlgD
VINYPLYNLAPGTHTILFTIWDANDNFSQAEIEFVVVTNALILDNLSNYPNPLNTYTNFTFSYNQPDENIDVSISIYNISGQIVKTILTNINSYGFSSPPIQWDGTSDYGVYAGDGIYLYRLKISNSEGQSAEKYGKLIIVR